MQKITNNREWGGGIGMKRYRNRNIDNIAAELRDLKQIIHGLPPGEFKTKLSQRRRELMFKKNSLEGNDQTN